MSRTQNEQYKTVGELTRELLDSLNSGVFGLLLLLLGGYWLVTLLNASQTPWLVKVTGWTAPWVALATLLLGVVIVLGPRAGYWSAEALLGIQLLLLSLMALTYLVNTTVPDWSIKFDGSNGGLVGWTLGAIFLSALGQWPAILLVLLLGLVGAGLLLRYTPLVYVTAFMAAAVPTFAERWTAHPQNEHPPEWENPPVAEYAPPPPQVTPEAEPKTATPAAPQVTPEPAARPPASNPAAEKPTAATKTKRKSATKSQSPKRKRKSQRKRDQLPSVDLLESDTGTYDNADERELMQRVEQVLDDFNVPVRAVHAESGPTVTQIGVEPLYIERSSGRRKVRVSRIVTLADDLALALEAPSVRIEAPVPGRPYVGIEIPNHVKTMVGLRGILESPEWRREAGQLALALGRNTAGKPVLLDLARAPHLLIAGATGSGKSVCINTIVTSLLMQHGPESLQFLMVDPKMVELPGYNGIPHLIGRVVTEMDQVMGMLTWLLLQMDDRYRLFKEVGVRNIDSYNEKVRQQRGKDAPKPLPYMVLIIDELADLMMTAADDIERQICRLAQMARATGIHLILATQRPSTDVVTGLIKANFPTRIAFAVTSAIDSRVILDGVGAERLLGRGDMLLMRSDEAKLQRVQGCFASDEEINKVVEFWKNESTGDGDEATQRPTVPPWNGLLDRMDDDEELIMDAIDILRELDSCSTSLIQRKLRIGYPKAARLMEELEARKIVGPDQGGGQGRPVLLRQNQDDENDEEEMDEDSY